MSVLDRPFQPLVEELRPAPAVEDAFERLVHLDHCLFLDSAVVHPALGRYSFLAADPVVYWQVPVAAGGDEDLWHRLAAELAPLHTPAVPGVPPFQGGAGVFLSYDLHHRIEDIACPAWDEFQVPAMAVAVYDLVVAWDHAQQRAWMISQGLPHRDPARRTDHAARRLDAMRRTLAAPRAVRGSRPQCAALRPEQLAPQHAGPWPGLTSSFSEEGYLRAVRRVIDYIGAGDVFQVNLSQRLLHRATCDAGELYLRVRRANPAPFAGYFDLGRQQIVSASPERFLRVDQGHVETRPIKGTRRRCGDRELDQAVAQQLRSSPKDRAENVMIVDLLRNDLSRACRPESLRVSQLCEVEAYEHVLHLVSAVRGRLCAGLGSLDLVRAAFPGGSVTGAPKIRAMEIIAELEPTARGAYCGCLGYVGLDGSLDLNILIRTITAAAGWWQAPVGGGIVTQSIPTVEYQETWDKAEGLLQAMDSGAGG